MRSSLGYRFIGAALGLALDRLVGEPPMPIHPVSLFGRAMLRLERSMWKDSVIRGAIFASVGTVSFAAAGYALTMIARLSRYDSKVLETIVMSASTATLVSAGKSLSDSAMDVSRALAVGEISGARRLVSRIVGRDTESLDAEGISRAAIESVAENAVDAIVAPAIWTAVGGPAGGFAYRAINTLDAMVGYKDVRYVNFGRASAKSDDCINWAPARLPAAAVVICRPHRARHVIGAVLRDASAHPSPNGGVAEAAFAGALGIVLGGTNHYGGASEDRGTLGDGLPPTPEDIVRAVRLLRDVSIVVAVILLACSMLCEGAAGTEAAPVAEMEAS